MSDYHAVRVLETHVLDLQMSIDRMSKDIAVRQRDLDRETAFLGDRRLALAEVKATLAKLGGDA